MLGAASRILSPQPSVFQIMTTAKVRSYRLRESSGQALAYQSSLPGRGLRDGWPCLSVVARVVSPRRPCGIEGSDRRTGWWTGSRFWPRPVTGPGHPIGASEKRGR